MPTSAPAERIRDQALEVARGWSGPEAPAGWRLTASLFERLADDAALLELATDIPADRLPALLFVASVQAVIARHPDEPLHEYYPWPDVRPRPVDDGFGEHLRRFCDTHRDELRTIWRTHRYQMNEVARCTQVALALGVLQAQHPDRQLAIVDVGTSAGLGLFPDCYRYTLSDGTSFGDVDSPVSIDCQLHGEQRPPPPVGLRVGERIGIDANPIRLDDDEARDWLSACVPPDADAQRRLLGAIDVVRAGDCRIDSGDAIALLPDVLGAIPDGPLIAVIDAYTAVFFDDHGQRRMNEVVAECGSRRDVAWISLDPLVPLGTAAQRSVQALDVPPRLVQMNRDGGVFALLSIVAHVDGRTWTRLLATAHPSGTRMEWLDSTTTA